MEPRPAQLLNEDGSDAGPILWFGVENTGTSVVAVIATSGGRLAIAPLQRVRADVRYADDLGVYPALGRTGPGWVDVEDMVDVVVVGAPSAADLGDARKAAVEALTTPAAPVAGQDYLVGADGTRFDPLTNLPLDD